MPESTAVSKRMRANRKDETTPEVELRSVLHRRGLRFRKASRVAVGTVTVRPDVVFPRLRVAVFMDGCFWHSCPWHGTRPQRNSDYWLPKLDRTVRRDRLVTNALSEHGWAVIRLWEHELRGDSTTAIEQIVSVVNERRATSGAPR